MPMAVPSEPSVTKSSELYQLTATAELPNMYPTSTW